ncbi:MAG: DNA alkylation repair protein [Muribaculaceae bacterium]|nr:DNA alkylation repair protein [Muribaculaceae bacterium]
MISTDVIARLEGLGNAEQRRVLMRFFKTGLGEYGHGDEFLGVRVPQVRQVAKQCAALPLGEVPALLASPWHEVRLCGLLLMVDRFERLARKRLASDPEAIADRDEIVEMYLRYADRANNWDLVDLSAPKILGHWLLLPTAFGADAPGMNERSKVEVIDGLSDSDNLWRQRMSVVCTWKTTQQSDPRWCLRQAERHLHHTHDLMHKAVGWMLREVGKRVSMELLREFLRQHSREMPRTMLRYAIELMSPDERRVWMAK